MSALDDVISECDRQHATDGTRLFRVTLDRETSFRGLTLPPGSYDYDAEKQTFRMVR